MAVSQGYLDQLRAAHGAGMGSVRDSYQRSADQNNTVSGNPGLANNVGAYQAPRPPVSGYAAWRLRQQQQQQQNPATYAGATQRSAPPMTNGSFGGQDSMGLGQMPITDMMTYAAPRPPGLRQQMLSPQQQAQGMPNIQYGDPRVRQQLQQQMAPQQTYAQTSAGGQRDIYAGGGNYAFPRSISAR